MLRRRSAMPPPPVSPTEPRVLRWLLLAGAAAAAALFAFGASQRLLYPFEVEWMEGALVDHAWRVANGLPVYCEPGPEHVPFLYAPLPFWLGGALMALGLDGFLAMRAVSTAAAIGITLLIGHWVRRETQRVDVGLVAGGLFLAGYGWFAWWYDLARNDTLFVLGCAATAYVLRHGGARRWLPAAALATLAFLAKQSALMWLPAIGVGALCHDWRNALRFGLGACAGIGASVGAMHLASDGWSTFFLFEMPQHHGWNFEYTTAFWFIDLPPMLPLLALGVAGFVAQWRRGERGAALFLAAFGSGGILVSFLSRLHVGGFDNVVMYGFAAACVLGPAAAGMATSRLHLAAGALLLLAQFGLLGTCAAVRQPSTTLVPSVAHRRAHEQLEAFVATQPGPVWIPAHGGITQRAGKGTGAHGQAIFDLMQVLPRLPDGMLDLAAIRDPGKLAHLSPRGRRAVAVFDDRVVEALRQRRFAAIVVDEAGAGAFTTLFAHGLAGADGLPGTADDPYVRGAGPLGEPAAIRPLVGYEVHTPYVLKPAK
jgi:hypothetical protein